MARRLIISILIAMLPVAGAYAAGGKVLRLSADMVVDLVLERSFGVKQAELKREEAKEAIPMAKGAFDTYLAMEGSYEIDKSRRTSSIFGTRTDTGIWGLSLTKEIPIGTTLGVSLLTSRSKTTGSDVGGVPVIPPTPLYEPVLGFSLQQPLVQNAFGMAHRGEVRQARHRYAAADNAVRREIDGHAYKTLIDYWSMIFNREHMDAQRRSVRFARDFLSATLEKKKFGIAEETDVLAARANLLVRENEFLDLKETDRARAEEVRRDLELDPDVDIMGGEKSPPLASASADYDARYERALSRRGDYLAASEDIERLQIKLAVARNKRWPQLDLKSTLAINEIDASYRDAAGGMNAPDWTVGLSLQMPLENRAARAEARRASFEKARAVYALKDLENQIVNEVRTAVDQVNARKKIVEVSKGALAIQQEKLAQEMEKYEQGRSSSEVIIIYQDDVINAERHLVQAWMSYGKAVLDMKLAEATIVSNESIAARQTEDFDARRTAYDARR